MAAGSAIYKWGVPTQDESLYVAQDDSGEVCQWSCRVESIVGSDLEAQLYRASNYEDGETNDIPAYGRVIGILVENKYADAVAKVIRRQERGEPIRPVYRFLGVDFMGKSSEDIINEQGSQRAGEPNTDAAYDRLIALFTGYPGIPHDFVARLGTMKANGDDLPEPELHEPGAIGEILENDITVVNDNTELSLDVLEQYLDADAIRTHVVNPYASYSPNMLTVRAAITSVANAAATMHLSDLVKRYNSRAQRLFETTIEHLNKKNSEEFIGMFKPFSVKGGGYVLLQPVASNETTGYVERCVFPAQQSGDAKRVRLTAFIEDKNSRTFECPLVPDTDGTQYRRLARQYRENRREVARHTVSADIVAGDKDEFPLIPVPVKSYRVIAGAINHVDTTWQMFAETFVYADNISITGIYKYANGANEVMRLQTLPALIDMEEIDAITKRYGGANETATFVRDTETFVSTIRRLARERRPKYETDVDTFLADANAIITDIENHTGTITALTPDEEAAIRFFKAFYEWSKDKPERFVLAWVPTATFFNVKFEEDVEVTMVTLSLVIRLQIAVNASDNADTLTEQINEIAQFTDSVAAWRPRSGAAGFPDELTRLVIETPPAQQGQPPGDPEWAVLPRTVREIQDLRKEHHDYVNLTDRLRETLKTKEFTRALPSQFDRAPIASELNAPTAIERGYRPLVMRPENEVRFKLSLLPNKGFNPAYFGGSNATTNLDINPDDERRDFDDDMKRWEYNLHARNMDGYNDEWKATMQTALQVLITHARIPDDKRVPRLDVVDLQQTVLTGRGFFFVPHAPEGLRDNQKFRDRFVLPVRPASHQQYINNYPRWQKNGEGMVSQASLFWYHNAVATATEPFSVQAQESNLDDVAAMIASSMPFSALGNDDRILISGIMKTLCDEPLFKESKSLLLVQLTRASIVPGNSTFAQPFPPLRVAFKSAALTKGPGGVPRLEYTLGSEATTLVESMFIATALIKQILLARRAGSEDVNENEVPLVHTVPAMFPAPVTDEVYKESVVRSGSLPPLGFTRSYFTSDNEDGVADIDTYINFLGWPETATPGTLMNKAGRHIFGDASASPNDIGATEIRSAPGHYEAAGDARFERDEMTDDSPHNYAVLSNTVPPDYVSLIRDVYEGAPRVPNGDHERGRRRDFAYTMLKHRTTYDDYLACEMLIKKNDAGESVFSPDDWETTEPVSLPVYVFDGTKNKHKLLAYLHVSGLKVRKTPTDLNAEVAERKLWEAKENRKKNPGVEAEALEAEAQAALDDAVTNSILNDCKVEVDWAGATLEGVYAVTENVFEYNPDTGDIFFNYGIPDGSSVFVGLRLSDSIAKENESIEAEAFQQGRLAGRYFEVPTMPIAHAGVRVDNSRIRTNTPFIALRKLKYDKPLMKVSKEAWDMSIRAFNRYRTHPRATTFKKKSVNDVTVAEIKKALREGCQGLHFNNLMSLSSTTFAVAINDTYRKIKEWYEGPNPLCPTEPRAVNLETPAPGRKDDAALMNIIMREEMRGAGSGATATTSGTVLITPLVVEVCGPDPEALATVCKVEREVVVKTANFRVYETRLVSLLRQALSDIRSVSVIRDRARDCLGEILERDKDISLLSEMVVRRPSATAALAHLMIRLKDYGKISADTGQSRSVMAINVAYKELRTDVHFVLFRA